MLTEIGSELLVTGFVTLIHRLLETFGGRSTDTCHPHEDGGNFPLWNFLNREEINEDFFSLELAEMSEPEYQQFVERFAVHPEEN